MKKGGNATKNPPPGAIARLDRMIGKPKKRTKRIESHPDTDALLDMIDKRVGQLLLRSSKIESKLDSMEGPRSVKTSHSKTEKGKINKVRQTKTVEKVTTRSGNSTITIDSTSFNKLINLVQDLQNEIKQMHSEQNEMHIQLNRMQDALFQEAEEEDYE